jgi:hypothetical protein
MTNKLKRRALVGIIAGLFNSGCGATPVDILPYYSQRNMVNDILEDPLVVKNNEDLQLIQKSKWFFSPELTHPTMKNINVSNCLEVVTAVDSGYKSKQMFEQGAIDALHHSCDVLNQMLKLSLSKYSYLGDIALDKNFAKQAPAQFALVISNDDVRRVKKSASWEAMSQIQRVEKLNEEQSIYYDSRGSIQKVTLIAKGDYDGDAIEDMLLYVENSVEGGSYATVKAFFITRLKEGGPLLILKEL